MILGRLGRPGPIRGGGPARGVTYLELMVALGVMAILATVILPTGMKLGRRAKEQELKRALVKIRAAIDEYHQDWELGYIESDHDHGWPSSLEELTEEKEFYGPAPGQGAAAPAGGSGGAAGGFSQPNQLPGAGGGLPTAQSVEPRPKVYLRRIPKDPFNEDDDEWDVSGWRARSYDDDLDSSSWDGSGVYDVYSSADWLAIDGRSRYEEW